MDKPQVYKYDNYRNYLKACMDYMQAINPNYSYRQFSRDAGYKTSNHLQQIINGKYNISSEGISRIAKIFKLNKKELYFFKILVKFNHAKNVEARNKSLKYLLRFSAFKRNNPLMAEYFKYFTKWYYVVIREMTLLPEFQDDPHWIAEKLCPQISATEVVEALLTLVKLGYLKRDENGKLIQATDRLFDSGPEVVSTYMIKFHHQMIQKGYESIERINRDLRDVSAATFPINDELLPVIKEKIIKFRHELMEYTQEQGKANTVYNLNLQLFPLSKK